MPSQNYYFHGLEDSQPARGHSPTTPTSYGIPHDSPVCTPAPHVSHVSPVSPVSHDYATKRLICPRFHGAGHRDGIWHMPHSPRTARLLSAHHSAALHIGRKPSAASLTGHKRPRLPAFHTTPSRSSRIVHAVSPLPRLTYRPAGLRCVSSRRPGLPRHARGVGRRRRPSIDRF